LRRFVEAVVRVAERRFAVCAIALLALAPGTARAYVRTFTKGTPARPLLWQQTCVPVTIYVGDFEAKARITETSIVKSVAGAAHAWGPDAVTCPDGVSHPFIEIVPTLAPASAPAPAIADDSRNVVVFRTESWSLNGTAEEDPLKDALAYTIVTARGPGNIVDADILVNGVTRLWKDFEPGVTPTPDQGDSFDEFDLQAALVHEFGHFLGFSHSCVLEGESAKDDQGRDVPPCVPAPESAIRSVMFFRTAADDATKRVLSPDDVRGVCEVYASDTKSCAVDAPYDGCAVAPGRAAGAGIVAAAASFIWAWRRRRARA
jgi:hypothetical protein